FCYRSKSREGPIRDVAAVAARSPMHSRFPLGGNPLGRSQRQTRPVDKFVGLVEQSIWHTPEGKVYKSSSFSVVQGRRCAGLLEGLLVLVVNPKIEGVLGNHAEHRSITEYTCLSEHAPHGDVAERS